MSIRVDETPSSTAAAANPAIARFVFIVLILFSSSTGLLPAWDQE